MKKSFFFLLIVIMTIAASLYSQEISEKTEVSVFNLSYYSHRIPNSVLGNIDSTIRSVFVNMGRFKVIEVAKTFDNQKDLSSFIDQIRKFKEKKATIPAEVSYGHALFSEADFENLISSFIVIVPELLSYEEKEKYDKKDKLIGYEVNFKTSYSVIDASTMEVVAKPSIESNGQDKDDSLKALESAISSMSSQLVFELKKVPIFTIKTGVVEVKAGKITLKKGKNMGILPGFEFELMRTDILGSGDKKEFSDGLVIVSDVFEEVSDAVVLYGDAQEGDQLKEVPRAGGELGVYYHGIYDLKSMQLLSLVGIKATVTLGFFGVRPLVGIELPLFDVYGIGEFILAAGLPINFYIGCDFPIYFGRIQLSPTVTLGVGGLYLYEAHNDQQFAPTHFGPSAYLNVSYLVTRDVKLWLDVGGTYMFSIISDLLPSADSYYGAVIGFGVSAKI
jgi:hypothetical protein